MEPFQAQRQIHLDYHNSPHIPDLAADFDPVAFARVFKEAHVDSVTVFAKCHHGHLYYPSDHPARHPSLPSGLDLCGEMVAALHREGIRAPVYISVQCDEFAADTHPEWVVRNPDGTSPRAKPLEANWQILDLSSPYRAYLEAQTGEILARYAPVDGVFFDMCWNQPSVSKWAKAAMIAAGLDPLREEDRARHAADLADGVMGGLHRQVKRSAPEATVYFNSRPLGGLARDLPHLTHIEIEALPTGGWGYLYFPRNVRYVRAFNRPYIGMTARFHKTWGDYGSLKPHAALLYEVSQMLAHGAACSIGDQLPPRARPEPAAYRRIGAVYAHAKAREPWTAGAKPLVDIGLFRVDDGRAYARNPETDDGATRLLSHLKHQFDAITPAADFSAYRVLVLPDAVPVDAALAARLRQYLSDGGALLASGRSGLDTDGAALPELGVTIAGESPYQNVYLRFDPAFGVEDPDLDTVVYERTLRATALPGTATAAAVVEPYFERSYRHFCGHHQTPARPEASAFAGATLCGRAAYVAFPVFAAFGKHGPPAYRQLVGGLLERLLPEPLLRVRMPATAEATVMRHGDRTVVHLLHFVADRRNALDICEDILPLRDIDVSLRLERRPERVYLAPSGEALPFAWSGGRAVVRVPEIAGHGMVVFD